MQARRKVRHYTIKELPEELTESLSQLGAFDFSIEPEISKNKEGKQVELRADTHPSVVYVNYKSVVPERSDYLLPRIKIEISCLSMDEPVENKTIRSFISEVIPDVEDISIRFKTVTPVRTFLEKIFLLHEEFQKESPRSYRMTRHLYDLEKIMDTPFGKEALTDKNLYNEIIRHRSIFNHIRFLDYNTHAPAVVNFIPPQSLINDWEKDYNSLVEHFLYYDENKLSFDELMSKMRILLDRVRKITCR